jgi:hypothetical protein
LHICVGILKSLGKIRGKIKMNIKINEKKEIIYLIIGVFGAFLGLFGVAFFNQYILMSLSLWMRIIAMIVTYWIIALIPIIVMIIAKDNLEDYGFKTDNIGWQIIAGVLIGTCMSLVLTLIPHLLGLGEYVDNGRRYKYLWQFVYEIFYCILGIGFVEEFVFRGFIYEKIKRIGKTNIIAIIGSSILFGAFHLLSGNIVQMIVTCFLGVLFCLFRLKIKNCSILSLIIAHGIYDALISLWSSLLL